MITDNYIKMCKKAEEIQDRWRKPFRNKFGDFYWRGDRYLMIPEACILNTDSHFIPEEEVWLPTQEQLQEMITMDTDYAKEYNKKTGAIFCGFYIFLDMMDWVRNYLKKPTKINCNSLNEMWLAFVMHEKYHKIWTGEKWEEGTK